MIYFGGHSMIWDFMDADPYFTTKDRPFFETTWSQTGRDRQPMKLLNIAYIIPYNSCILVSQQN